MNCRKARSWFGAFLDQGLAPGKARDLMAHLETCTECARAWKRFRSSLGALKHLEQIEPSPGFETNLWRRIHREEAEPRWARRVWESLAGGALWPKMVGAAAAAAIVLGILLVGGVLGPGQRPGPPSIARDAVRSPALTPGMGEIGGASIETVAGARTSRGWEVPAWAGTRSGRLERGFSGFEGIIDTAGVEPEFVIRTVSQDPNAPPMRAF